MSINFTNSPFYVMLTDYEKDLSYISNTKTLANDSADESKVDNASVGIKGCLFMKEDVYNQDKFGLLITEDAVLIVKNEVTIAKDSEIVYDGITFKINTIKTRYLGPTPFYQVAQLSRV